jgi:single-strand DNA-binding protein
MSRNLVILLGNCGSDPEVRSLDSGKKVASFSLATTEQYKDRTTGERKSVTEWHKIVLWSPLADITEKYLKRGSKIFLEGRIKTRSYEINGEKKYITEIIGDNLTILGEKPQAVQQPIIEAGGRELSPADNGTDDLPF